MLAEKILIPDPPVEGGREIMLIEYGEDSAPVETGGASAEKYRGIAAYASFLQDSYGPSINGVRDGASNLCTAVGGLLAVLDVILATDGYNPQLLDRKKDLCTAYKITLHSLEQSALEQGLPDDYSMARERAKRFQANGLVRPCVAKEGTP